MGAPLRPGAHCPLVRMAMIPSSVICAGTARATLLLPLDCDSQSSLGRGKAGLQRSEAHFLPGLVVFVKNFNSNDQINTKTNKTWVELLQNLKNPKEESKTSPPPKLDSPFH